MEKIIFQVDGGLGKSIAATAVCKAIKKQYPDHELIVLTGYPQVFFCIPYVKVYDTNNLTYFYEEHVSPHKPKLFLHNPYNQEEFINGNTHLIEVWCKMFGIKYNGEQPELYMTDRELKFFSHSFASQKPILVIQTNGGASNQPNKYSWARDLPIATAQKVVNAFAHEYQIMHIRREDQLVLQNVTPITNANFRACITLIKMSSKRLFIDSFAQHTAAAIGLPSVVCWIANSPKQFGYDMHTNIVANSETIKPELRHSVFSKFNISGLPLEFPYRNENEILDADKIIDAVRNTPSIGRPSAEPSVVQIDDNNNQKSKTVKNQKTNLTETISEN